MVHISMRLMRGSVKGELRRGGGAPRGGERPRLLHYVRLAAIAARYAGRESPKLTLAGSQGAGRRAFDA